MADIFFDPLGYKIIRREPLTDDEDIDNGAPAPMGLYATCDPGKDPPATQKAARVNVGRAEHAGTRPPGLFYPVTRSRLSEESTRYGQGGVGVGGGVGGGGGGGGGGAGPAVGRNRFNFFFLLFPVGLAAIFIVWFFWPRTTTSLYGDYPPVRDLPGGASHVALIGGTLIILGVFAVVAMAYQKQRAEAEAHSQTMYAAFALVGLMFAVGWFLNSRGARVSYSGGSDKMSVFRSLGLYLLMIMCGLALVLFCYWGRFPHSGNLYAPPPQQGSDPGQRQSIGQSHFRKAPPD